MELVPSSHIDLKAKLKERTRMLLLRGRDNGVIAPSAMLKIAKEIDAKRKSNVRIEREENVRVS